MAAEEPERKKRRRRKKSGQRKSAGEHEREGEPQSGDETKDPKANAPSSEGKKRTLARLFWPGVVAIAVFELVVYGYRGEVEVCAGRDGQHDFALIGEPYTDDNRTRHPACVTTLNVGLASGYEEAHQDAAIAACRRVTLFQGQETLLHCAAAIPPWKHELKTAYVPPWDERFYKKLLWFLF